MKPHQPTTRFKRQPPTRYRYVRLRWRVLFTVVDALGAALFSSARWVRSLWKRLGDANEYQKTPRRILLVQLDHLGDAIISTGMFPSLRRRFPDASIDVLVGAWNRTLMEGVPEVDRVLVMPTYRFNRLSSLGWMAATLRQGLRLRGLQYDLAIDVRGDFPIAMMLWISGARQRVGWNAGGGGFLLTDSPVFVSDRPEVESRRALLRLLNADTENDEPRYHVDDVAREEVRAMIPSLPDSRRVVLHVGAGTQAKQWPAERWRALAKRIVAQHLVEVILVGSPGERALSERIVGQTDDWPKRLSNMTGRLSIAELAALLETADLFVGADSGPAHLAAAVQTPVLALFSGTNRARQWKPHGQSVHVITRPVACGPCHREQCPVPEHPCMTGISVDQVATQVARLLDEPVATDRSSHLESEAQRKGIPQ